MACDHLTQRWLCALGVLSARDVEAGETLIGEAVTRLMDGTLIGEALRAAEHECDQVRAVGRGSISSPPRLLISRDALQPRLTAGASSARHNWGALRIPLEQAHVF